ncbi:MAG: hypothetical protein M3N53_05180 [Actinomycetota bacterium]|nr:hypothetical protein [Actinomycetota bacterium]
MIETFIIDWPILAFFGFFFGGSAPKRGALRSSAFAGGLIATGGLTASAMLSNKHAPDWMWMYFRDPRDMEPVVRLMPLGYLLAFVGSFLTALRLRSSGSAAVSKAAGLAVAAEVGAIAATWDRYHRIGSKTEWENGTADELVTAKPQGKAKRIAGYAPLVIGTFAAGVTLAWRGHASAARR